VKKARVRNVSSKKNLGEFELCDSFFSRFRGLMFRKKPVKLLFVFPFTARHAIHSLFVFFPFTAVFLDERKRVVDALDVEPFSLYAAPRAPARYALELPVSEKPPARKGDRIEW